MKNKSRCRCAACMGQPYLERVAAALADLEGYGAAVRQESEGVYVTVLAEPEQVETVVALLKKHGPVLVGLLDTEPNGRVPVLTFFLPLEPDWEMN